MKKIFLDTSAYSAFKRNHPEIIEVIIQADRLYLNPIVIGELLSGFDNGQYAAKNRAELREFLNRSVVTVIPMTEETSERYSFIHNHLRKKGTPITTNDLWIAASVLETGTFLLTADTDFQKLELIPSIVIRP